MSGGWAFSSDGSGPGIKLDQQSWQDLLGANDAELKNLLKVTSIQGFRAPRLEVNDSGLNAIKAVGYQYDENLEEILPDGQVDALIAVDTDSQKGFNWVPWPYTLDNGSRGIWTQQVTGDKKWVTNFPSGIWEVPVYQVYVPSKDGLGTTIANAMLASDKDCTFPPGTPSDQMQHCYLSDGELNPGDAVKEVTSFDFNTFIYSRMTAAQWLTVLKHTFLARYYGNRAPMTYGAHPIEYTDPYDSYTLSQQGNNYGYRDVLKYNTYPQRQQAMKDFLAWIAKRSQLQQGHLLSLGPTARRLHEGPFDKTGREGDAGRDGVARLERALHAAHLGRGRRHHHGPGRQQGGHRLQRDLRRRRPGLGEGRHQAGSARRRVTHRHQIQHGGALPHPPLDERRLDHDDRAARRHRAAIAWPAFASRTSSRAPRRRRVTSPPPASSTARTWPRSRASPSNPPPPP